MNVNLQSDSDVVIVAKLFHDAVVDRTVLHEHGSHLVTVASKIMSNLFFKIKMFKYKFIIYE